MTMEQFAKSMLEQENPSPLLQALQALRSRNLEQVRENGYFLDWTPWSGNSPAQPPQIYVMKPEIRN